MGGRLWATQKEMSAELIIAIGGFLVAFAGLCVTVWKVRKADWQSINNKIESQSVALAAFKLEVSQLHPTAQELRDIEHRLTQALEKLADRIDRMLERR